MKLAGNRSSAEHLARIIWECLREEDSVEIEGLGVFRRVALGGVEFIANVRPKVFLAYVREDFPAVERLYNTLVLHGFDPWLDKKKLLPGQNWPRAIEREISISDFFMPVFSTRSVSKRGQFHCELRHAMACASRLPLDEIFMIPVRLDDCGLPPQIEHRIHYEDLFPDWDEGFHRILTSLREEMRQRGQKK